MTDKTEISQEFQRKIRPVRVFLSYAAEDDEIMRAVSDSLDALSATSGSNVRTLFDKKSIEVGSQNPIRDEIENKLLSSDYLFILYTGMIKKSHSYTGAEIGFYRGLIRSDEEKGIESQRKIIPIYFGERPPIDSGELGINLQVSASDLRLSHDEYKAAVNHALAHGHRYDELVKLCRSIGSEADERLPEETGKKSYDNPADWQDYLDKMIEFHIDKKHSNVSINASIPDDTRLTAHAEAFSLFKVGRRPEDDQITWGQFKQSVRNNTTTDAEPLISSIESAAISAISPMIERDDGQIIKALDGSNIYRIIITRQFEYYDSSKLVHMYFIPVMRLAFQDGSDAAITLGFINVAIRYRELFLNPTSDISLAEFYRLGGNFTELKKKIHNAMRELLLIEDESRVLGLERQRSIAVYYGSADADARRIADIATEFKEARRLLYDAASSVLALEKGVPGQQKEQYENWMKALSSFIATSKKSNAELLSRALENLKSYLFADGDDKDGEKAKGG